MDLPAVVRQTVLTSISALALACGDPMTPTTPTLPAVPAPTAPAASAAVWGFVADQSGACIAGAVVEVVSGQGLGRTAPQEGPCSVWDYGDGGGFTFTELTPGVAMTLRARAPGYESRDLPVTPPTIQAVEIILRKAN